MNNNSLPPPHPSLPQPPAAGSQTHPGSSYGYPYPAYYTCSPHYAQAYCPRFNSSSDVPTNPVNKGQGIPPYLMSTWYQAGNIRCSYPGCAFQGSRKSVEVHKMDRHLIYPPDWNQRKKRPEWDADPTLKGKLIPIQGTNVILDTPEVIDAWIAERRKRFPTSARVEEKKKKMAEAVERGQLDLNPARPPKRRKIDSQTDGADRWRSRMHASRGKSVPGRHRRDLKSGQDANAHPTARLSKNENKVSDDDDDAPPEELSSKLPALPENTHHDETVSAPSSCSQLPPPLERRRLTGPQPRGPTKNPFASRPALLRNLLLPEIRMTVSNLSQAIRFLVDNDFLRNVELKPGQATEQQKICVLSS